MLRSVLPLLVASLFVTSAHAQAPEGWDLAGTYIGYGEGELTATFDRQQGDTFDVLIETVIPAIDGLPGCSGSVQGEMEFTFDGGTLAVANPNYEAGANRMGNVEFCEVKMLFNEDGELHFEENRGCLNFHGAACSFDGHVVSLNAAS